MIKNFVKIIIKIFFAKFINFILYLNRYVIIFRNGSAIGDHVYLTSVIREISIYKKKRIILFTNYHEFFLNNPRILKLVNLKKDNIIWFFLNILKGDSILEFRSIYSSSNQMHFLYFHKNKEISLAQANAEHFPIDIDFSLLKNEIFFSKIELKKYKEKFNLPKNFSLIQSTSKKTFTKNKEWKVSGMQYLVDSLSQFNWVQIGKSEEPKLKNCRYIFDLDLRELSYIISKCSFLIVYEGLFNHIASCFNKKTFIIHVGFLHMNSFKYENNIIIEQNYNLDCYPCYSLNCKKHNNFSEKFMSNKFVLDQIKKNL